MTTTRSWKTIWDARTLDATRPSVLAQLMAADGFDSGFGDLDEAGWRSYVDVVTRALDVTPETSVYEVGCGAGAFLYDWYQQGTTVAGLDASETLLGFARQAMPRAELVCAEAAALDPATPYDVVVSSGVFLYFPSLDYAADVLARMWHKARRAIAVLDVPDAARRDAAIAMRRGFLDEAAYEAKYRGLEHLYIPRDWFTAQLAALGAARVSIVDQAIAGYANGAHRYNVVAHRR